MDKDKQLLTNGLDLSLEELGEIFKAVKCIIWEEIKAKFPGVSGIEAYKKEKLHEIEEQRLTTFIKTTQDKQKYLGEEKLDKEFLKTEEFARMVFNILEKVKNDYREEKIKYYSNILINYSTVNFSNDFYKEGIIDVLARLTPEHIVVLNETNRKGGIDFYKPHSIEGLSTENERLCIIQLNSEGLLKKFDGRINEGISFVEGEPYFVSDYGKKCLELIANNFNNN